MNVRPKKKRRTTRQKRIDDFNRHYTNVQERYDSYQREVDEYKAAAAINPDFNKKPPKLPVYETKISIRINLCDEGIWDLYAYFMERTPTGITNNILLRGFKASVAYLRKDWQALADLFPEFTAHIRKDAIENASDNLDLIGQQIGKSIIAGLNSVTQPTINQTFNSFGDSHSIETHNEVKQYSTPAPAEDYDVSDYDDSLDEF